LKFGTTKLTTIKEVSLPVITLTQKIAFSILCAIEVYYNDEFLYWADNWLKNIDRTSLAAYAAAYAADAAAYAARAAADAYAACTACTADAVAADAAAYAARAAAYEGRKINLIEIVEKCLGY